MRALPAVVMLGILACAGEAGAGAFEADGTSHRLFSGGAPAAPPGTRIPTISFASLLTSVGESEGLTQMLSAPEAQAAAMPAPTDPDLLAGQNRHLQSSALWGQAVPHPPPARAADRPAPAGLLMDASTDQAPDSGAMRPRVPGAYAPYQAPPPLLEQKLDAPALLASLASRGFTDVSQLRLRGSAYTCEATGPRRERVRLVVDAASGAIFGVEVIGYDSRRN